MLDRLGRDAIDISTTVRRITEMGVSVYCLALGGADLTGAVMRGTRLTGADLDATILRQLVAADGVLGLDQARNLDRALRDPP